MSKKKKEKKKGYIILPGLSFAIRMILLSVLILGGLAIQLLFSQLFPGMLLIFVGSLLSMQRSISTVVKYSKREDPEWKTVSEEEWDRIEKLKKDGRKWQSNIGNLNSVPGALFFVVLLVIRFVVFVIFVDEDDMMFVVFIGDVLALYLPLMLTGSLKAWAPPGISIKIKALKNVLSAHEASEIEGIEIKPMLGLVSVRGKTGKIPVDAKMMIRFKDTPEDFYGVQVQCSLNDVSGTKYPYLYCVILCSPDFPVDPGKLPLPSVSDIVFEPSRSAEAKLLVIRLKTTKASGYHTDAKTQVRVVRTALEVASQMA